MKQWKVVVYQVRIILTDINFKLLHTGCPIAHAEIKDLWWTNVNPRGGVLHNFQHGEVHANIWGLKFYVNQCLESVNYNMDKSSILRVHKSEKRKNHGIWCGSPKYWTQCLGSPKC